MDAARAEQPLAGVERLADDAFQRDCRRLHEPHLAGSLVDKPIDPGAYAESLATEGRELGIDREPAVGQSGVERRKNLVVGPYAHEVPGLKAKVTPWRGMSQRKFPLQPR